MDLGIVGLGPVTEVGRGRHARVYRAQQDEMGRQVAVKVYDSPWNEEIQRSFVRERQTTIDRLSDHAGVVPVLGSGRTAEHQPYLLMPMYENGSLGDHLDPNHPLPWTEASGLLETVASTVADIHVLGIVHRNLKPNNVLLSNLGQPEVSDLATAALSPVDFASPYVAPETLDSGEATAASDVFSLGAVFLAMLTGRPPSVPPDVAPSSQLGPEIPTAFGTVIDQAMAGDPGSRPADGAEFLRLLRQAMSSAHTVHPTAAASFVPLITPRVAPQAQPEPAPEMGPETSIIDPLALPRTERVVPRDLGPLLVGALGVLLLIAFGTGAYLAFGRGADSAGVAAGAATTDPEDNITEVSGVSTEPTVLAETTEVQLDLSTTTTPSNSTTEAPTTTESPTTTTADESTSTSESDVAPRLLSIDVVDVTDVTARVVFQASECTGTRYEVLGVSSDAAGYPNQDRCWNNHQLLLGREPFTPSLLSPDTEYSVTVVLVDEGGLESSPRTITFRTDPEVTATAPVISGLTVSDVTATSARISFTSDLCTGASYVVNGSPEHTVGYPFADDCFTNHWAELGTAPYSSAALNPETTYRVVVQVFLADGTASAVREVSFTTKALATTSTSAEQTTTTEPATTTSAAQTTTSTAPTTTSTDSDEQQETTEDSSETESG